VRLIFVKPHLLFDQATRRLLVVGKAFAEIQREHDELLKSLTTETVQTESSHLEAQIVQFGERLFPKLQRLKPSQPDPTIPPFVNHRFSLPPNPNT